MSTARRVVSVLAVAAVAVTVAACDKPEPKVTFQSGSTSVVVDRGHGAEIDAKAGSTILVDVPRNVSDGPWIAQSLAPDSDGKWTQLNYDGSVSPVIRDDHTTRLVVPHVTGDGNNTYAVVVAEVGRTDDQSLWKLAVNVTN